MKEGNLKCDVGDSHPGGGGVSSSRDSCVGEGEERDGKKSDVEAGCPCLVRRMAEI